MRVKSELWVKAYIRSAAVAGAPGVVAHRGDADAGVILIKVARLDGTADLFGPAPAGMQSDDGERRWVQLADRSAESEVDRQIAAELRLDRDTWVVEIEERTGRHFLDGWIAEA